MASQQPIRKSENKASNRKEGNKKQNSKQKLKGGPRNDNVDLDDDIGHHIEEQIRQGKKVNGNSRKNQISISHLLDFPSYSSLPSYKRQQVHRSRRRSSNRGNYHDDDDKFKVSLSGMRFINVNYKFVVDCRHEYKAQRLDTNVPVELDQIMRIVVSRGNSCPICLSDEPVAPRMLTSCGHILCLTCLLSLLDSEVPTAKKKEVPSVVEKNNECPLCFSIIRKREVKPVIISGVEEHYEIPKVNDEAVLTLMVRPHERIFALPIHNCELFNWLDDIPWYNETQPDCSQYLRLFKGDLEYALSTYEMEKTDILDMYKQDQLVYDDNDVYVKMALEDINKEIELWKLLYENHGMRKSRPHSHAVSLLDSKNSFYYYQTGFNAYSVYILSPLDMKVLKTNYDNDYANMPSSVVTKIENIRYEELTPKYSHTKYKYLSHLPLGTSIGFIECDWNHNDLIKKSTWDTFKEDLIKRTKETEKKFRKEEKDRKKAVSMEEVKTKEFFDKENSLPEHGDNFSVLNSGFESLTLGDHLPPLPSGTAGPSSTDNGMDLKDKKFETSIWGTKVPKAEIQELENGDNDDWNADEMIKKAKEEMYRQDRETNFKGKIKKKKHIVISSNSNW